VNSSRELCCFWATINQPKVCLSMLFASLGLCDELLKAVAEQAYTTPTAIQLEAIPAVLSQRDVMAAAHTGTGKTASFTLPIRIGAGLALIHYFLWCSISRPAPTCSRSLCIST